MSAEEDVEKLFRDMVSGQNDRINHSPVNRLSVSGLSFGIKYEIERKLGVKTETFKDQLNMFKGTALHVHVQNLAKSLGYSPEYRCYYSIPFEWNRLKFREIILAGSIDLIHWERREIIELKSSQYSDKIEQYHKIQLAAYVNMMKFKTGNEFTGLVVKFGGKDLILEELKSNESSELWGEILNRARLCASELDNLVDETASVPQDEDRSKTDSKNDLYFYDEN